MPFSASLRQTKVGCPQQNAYAESFVSAIKRECVDKMIFFGERPLRRTISQFAEHFHRERNHQGIENVIPFPNAPPKAAPVGD
jgi:transposase InsO family protein